MKIGVISDTHGLIQPAAFDYLEGSDLILHAGDIGGEAVLAELEILAPVRAVRGNTDTFPIAGRCKDVEFFEAAGKKVYLTHRFIEGSYRVPTVVSDVTAKGPDIVIFGHTHHQHSEVREGKLFFNPGSAGHVRPGTRPAVGVLTINNSNIEDEFFYLDSL